MSVHIFIVAHVGLSAAAADDDPDDDDVNIYWTTLTYSALTETSVPVWLCLYRAAQ